MAEKKKDIVFLALMPDEAEWLEYLLSVTVEMDSGAAEIETRVLRRLTKARDDGA